MSDNTKPSRVAHTIRAMVAASTQAAKLIESRGNNTKAQMERAIGRLMFKTCVLDGHIPWLKKQYKEWK